MVEFRDPLTHAFIRLCALSARSSAGPWSGSVRVLPSCSVTVSAQPMSAPATRGTFRGRFGSGHHVDAHAQVNLEASASPCSFPHAHPGAAQALGRLGSGLFATTSMGPEAGQRERRVVDARRRGVPVHGAVWRALAAQVQFTVRDPSPARSSLQVLSDFGGAVPALMALRLSAAGSASHAPPSQSGFCWRHFAQAASSSSRRSHRAATASSCAVSAVRAWDMPGRASATGMSSHPGRCGTPPGELSEEAVGLLGALELSGDAPALRCDGVDGAVVDRTLRVAAAREGGVEGWRPARSVDARAQHEGLVVRRCHAVVVCGALRLPVRCHFSRLLDVLSQFESYTLLIRRPPRRRRVRALCALCGRSARRSRPRIGR